MDVEEARETLRYTAEIARAVKTVRDSGGLLACEGQLALFYESVKSFGYWHDVLTHSEIKAAIDYYFGGLNGAEIADMYGWSDAYCRKVLSNATKKLAKAMVEGKF